MNINKDKDKVWHLNNDLDNLYEQSSDAKLFGSEHVIKRIDDRISDIKAKIADLTKDNEIPNRTSRLNKMWDKYYEIEGYQNHPRYVRDRESLILYLGGTLKRERIYEDNE